MPTYTYKREDGTVFDYVQRMSDDSLTVCPTTNQKVTKVFHAPELVTTDTRRKGINQRKRNNAEQHYYTSLPEYKDKVEEYKDKNKVPTYKKDASSKPITVYGK